MRAILLWVIVLSACSILFGQSDLQKMVNTEQEFARFAAEKDTRTAFLANMTDDAVVFVPQMTNAKANWTAKPTPTYLLSWAPNFADISSSGILGYTTGNWEFRPKGKDDTPSGFGEFVTLWLRQPDGKYKWVVDIGIEHPKPEKYSTDWATAESAKAKKVSLKLPTADAAEEFYQFADANGLSKAYDKFADKNIRSYREGQFPFLGRDTVLKMLKSDKATFAFAKQSTAFTAGDISYNLAAYKKALDGKIEEGNFLQIWKFSEEKWRIVLDVFLPLPKK